ncbi:hypothetical protein [Okeania sp. SIO2B3]|uniref:hypothetical protein n=1 Tax=Okeania sp. SIO2B3 TaxID=2607784 RepID=UPI0013BF78B9|nr:hypothetical protein [Okeania sp. SIO2B3]NET46704.1 hypothetical protein [Okeania sp. SIO2B3]
MIIFRRFLIISVFILILSSSAFASGGSTGDSGSTGGGNDGSEATLEVEIDTGPRFHIDDDKEIEYCTTQIFWNFFPMDFLYNGGFIPGSSECPSVEFFGYEHQMCFLLDAYNNVVSPAFQLSLLIYAIFHL